MSSENLCEVPVYFTQSPDTSREAEEVLFALYRRMGPLWRIHRMGELGKMIENIALQGLRQRCPDATERELRLRLAAREFGRETKIKLFGWDPEVKGR